MGTRQKPGTAVVWLVWLWAIAVLGCEGAPRAELLAGKACSTDGRCAAGYVCDHALDVCVPDGTPLGSGGGGHGAQGGDPQGGMGGDGAIGAGGEGGCISVADCPPPAGPCETPACFGGQCGAVALPMGTQANMQTPGDCSKSICDGFGNVIAQNDAEDLPIDGTECTDDICNGGEARNPPVAIGASCADSGGVICDSMGSCVECVTAADCTMLPPNDTCRQRSCNAGVCEQIFAPPSTVLPNQVAGDCQQLVCDGMGGVTTENLDSDAPDDDNDCTGDVCEQGSPDHPFLPDTQSCGAAGTCDGMGACIGCSVPTDCAGTDTFCRQRTCVANACGFTFTSAGTALPAGSQTAGDCQRLQCDGNGNITSVHDNADAPPDDGNTCTGDTCVSGAPQHPPLALDTTCAEGMGIVCDGEGSCVACNSGGQCANQGTVCQVATCIANACGLANTADGVAAPLSTQTEGDCRFVECDGLGGTESVIDNADLPVDGNPCTLDQCNAGVPSNPNAMAGIPCGTNGTCDGAGNCENANLPLGAVCVASADCMSGMCRDGRCCNESCGDVCEACSAAKTGGTDGTCAFVTAATDPDYECAANEETCDGSGVCDALCEQDPLPPGGACPTECTGGCAGRMCFFDCNAAGSCTGQTLTCPDGFACEVQCGGATSCDDAVVECPALYACSVVCTGDCKAATVQCSAGGLCSLDCGGGQQCQGTSLDCGGNRCTATCAGGAFPAVACNGNTCGCDTCELPNGSTCDDGSECLSGECPADGVCCDEACGGTCRACTLAKTGLPTGTCGEILANTDPDNECTGLEVCLAGASCGLKPDGASCTAAAQCVNSCPVQDGVCCATPCGGLCESCLMSRTGQPDGVCAPVMAGMDPNNECPGMAVCTGAGTCN